MISKEQAEQIQKSSIGVKALWTARVLSAALDTVRLDLKRCKIFMSKLTCLVRVLNEMRGSFGVECLGVIERYPER